MVASLLLAALLASPAVPSPASTPPAPNAVRSVTCSFSHPAYSGYCRQTEKVPKNRTPEAVCRQVLSCLNDLGCTKTYCGATTLRGGWQLVSADPDRSGAEKK